MLVLPSLKHQKVDSTVCSCSFKVVLNSCSLWWFCPQVATQSTSSCFSLHLWICQMCSCMPAAEQMNKHGCLAPRSQWNPAWLRFNIHKMNFCRRAAGIRSSAKACRSFQRRRGNNCFPGDAGGFVPQVAQQSLQQEQPNRLNASVWNKQLQTELN